MTTSQTKPAVIVLSSHVVRGSVGNRAVVFALERLGFPVWAVPTVTLPWHPGHGRGTRIVPDPEQFAALTGELERAPWLGEVGAVLSGYLGHAGQATAVSSLVAAVKAKNPEAAYMCDPVMGDAEGLYVPQGTAEAIRDQLLPFADIATPNRYELDWLTGTVSGSNTEAARAALSLEPSTVLVTSAHAMMAGSIGNLLVTPREVLLAEHRMLPNPPSGTRDLASALFLAHLLEGQPPEKALQKATAAVFETVARSVKRGGDELMLETDSDSLIHPMALVQTRRLVYPTAGNRA